jgi:hypothetical protein
LNRTKKEPVIIKETIAYIIFRFEVEIGFNIFYFKSSIYNDLLINPNKVYFLKIDEQTGGGWGYQSNFKKDRGVLASVVIGF